jgi:FkbM family methyltransferase
MSGRRRLRLAQRLRALPRFPGRDACVAALSRPALSLDAPLRESFGGGLRFEGNLAADSSLLRMVLLRHARPPLAPVLDAALAAGSRFADVGANLGVYTLWAARRVGPGGRVFAFEPAEAPRNRLRRNLELNGFENVLVEARAVGAEKGRIALRLVEGSSARASRYGPDPAGPGEVPMTTLDAYFDGRRPPELVKVDVQGMEGEVLRGGSALLRGAQPPALLFEARADELEAAGTSCSELLGLLAAARYQVFALGPRGLERVPEGAKQLPTADLLALRRDRPEHERIRGALARTRFEPDLDT